ncbi:MAG: hypothetical protein AUK47_09095 [Deltaproteobacteria bacterium CG2_30_63_29]|nr:MAG: hypothetical protein AUK47_09095 [Deltaproteobacteria bacterium CG2_30_63_29]PJB42307.1 MAG: hypothetical protein CO108_11855 [Deltaproteobacteria bacterium CG_4_9_14_3_um_filter_63_12]
MNRSSHALLFILALSLLLAACGADDPGETADASDATGSETSSDLNIGEFTIPTDNQVEPNNPADEAGDCVAGCAHDVPAAFDYTGYDAYQGKIDGECHVSADGGAIFDTDVIGFHAATARTLLEITVTPSEGSKLDPVIITNDGNLAMTYNDERSSGESTARTVVAYPYVTGLDIYLAIDDAKNYESYDPDKTYTDCSTFTGGDDYGYYIQVKEIPYSDINLGTLAAGVPLTGSGALTQGGDLQHFSFKAPADAQPTVVVRSTGSDAFIPTLVEMNSVQGQLKWNRLADDGGILGGEEVLDGTVTLSGGFRACETSCPATVEFIFAVLDWNGVAWPGAFTFDVEVTL